MDRRQFGLGALSFGLAAGSARADAAHPTPEELTEIVRGTTKAPALAIMAVTPAATPFFVATGFRRNGSPQRVTLEDKWHLGSNTKAMTAALYGRLVEKGHAKWGATLAELFPDLRLAEAWKATPVEALMGHRAGLVDAGLTDGAWVPHLEQLSSVVEQRTELAGRALATPPQGTVGAFQYANANYILLGAAIERITRTPWEDAIRAELWGPLGITSAGFGAPKGPNPWGHAPAFFGATTPGPRPLDPAGEADNPPALGPAGTAHMSMADYAKWLRVFIADGAGVLSRETVARLTTAVPGPTPPSYALGWGLAEAFGNKILAHSGSNTFWYCTAQVWPARRMAFAAFSNDASPDGGAKAVASAMGLLNGRFPPPAPTA